MNFFFRSKDNQRPVETARRQQAEHKISMTGRDYTDLRKCTVALKVWLPESVERQLGEVTTYLNTSVSDFVRQILFQHLYGRYDLIGLVERQRFRFEEESPYHGIRCSIAPGSRSEPPPPPPRKVAGVKVFIPERMHADLKALADAKYKTISEYVRMVILNHLLGTVNAAGISLNPPQDAKEGIETA